jgi:hypothetical protein
MEIIVGPAKPVITFNAAYGLYEATISEISSEAYPADHKLFPGNSDYAAIADEEALMGDGQIHTVGSSRMCFYKMPWSTNAGIVNAYQNAFSYELIYSAPEYTDNRNNNIFGNINPTHCGFGIRRADDKNMFTYHLSYGATLNVSQKNDKAEDVTVEFGKYYHIVATYDKNSPTELIALYVDGVKVGSSSPSDGSKSDLGKALHFPTDYYNNPAHGSNIAGGHASRTSNTEFLCIGAGSHQGGYGRFGAPHNTKIVVARVYGHALNQTEVSTLYNYHVPE